MRNTNRNLIGIVLPLLSPATVLAQEGGMISDQNMIFVLPIQPDAPTWGPDIIRPSYTTTTGQMTDLSETNQQLWFYRLPTDTRENCLNSSGGATQEIDGNRIVVHQLYDGWTADQTWEVTSTGTNTGYLTSTLTLNNASAADLTISVYYYADLDVEGTFTNDTARLQRDGAIRVRDRVGPLYATYTAPGADAYQVTPYRSLLIDLTDFALTDLDNSGLPFHGDFTGAFQWNLTIAAGESVSVSAKMEWKEERQPAPIAPAVQVGGDR